MSDDNVVISKQVIREGLIKQMSEVARPGAFEIFTILLAYSDDDNTVQVKRKTIQNLSGYSQQKINKVIRDLEKTGFIERLNPGIRRLPSRWIIKFS